jgi:SulP family sulfate permease
MASRLHANIQPKLILPSLTIGLVFGIRNSVVILAYALMIFSGGLAASLPVGITVLFLGGSIFALVAALGSSLPGTLSGVQDSPSVIMATVIAAMLASMPQASSETKLYTALAAIMMTSLLTGLVCLLLGKFKLGNLVSYIPYPVVGGFLAGTGMLLILGALKVMIGKTVTLFSLGLLFQGDIWLHWATGVGFAIILFILVKKIRHYLVMPGMLAVAVALFYLVLAASRLSLPGAAQAGWLVRGMPQGESLFRFWDPTGFSQVNWSILLGQVGSLVA